MYVPYRRLRERSLVKSLPAKSSPCSRYRIGGAGFNLLLRRKVGRLAGIYNHNREDPTDWESLLQAHSHSPKTFSTQSSTLILILVRRNLTENPVRSDSSSMISSRSGSTGRAKPGSGAPNLLSAALYGKFMRRRSWKKATEHKSVRGTPYQKMLSAFGHHVLGTSTTSSRSLLST